MSHFGSRFGTQKFDFFSMKILHKNLFPTIFQLSFQQEKTEENHVYVSHECSLGHCYNFYQDNSEIF